MIHPNTNRWLSCIALGAGGLLHLSLLSACNPLLEKAAADPCLKTNRCSPEEGSYRSLHFGQVDQVRLGKPAYRDQLMTMVDLQKDQLLVCEFASEGKINLDLLSANERAQPGPNSKDADCRKDVSLNDSRSSKWTLRCKPPREGKYGLVMSPIDPADLTWVSYICRAEIPAPPLLSKAPPREPQTPREPTPALVKERSARQTAASNAAPAAHGRTSPNLSPPLNETTTAQQVLRVNPTEKSDEFLLWFRSCVGIPEKGHLILRDRARPSFSVEQKGPNCVVRLTQTRDAAALLGTSVTFGQ